MEAKNAADLVKNEQFNEANFSVLYDALKGNPEYADLLETLAKYAAKRADKMAQKKSFDKENAGNLFKVLYDYRSAYPTEFGHVYNSLNAEYAKSSEGGSVYVEQSAASQEKTKQETINIVVEQQSDDKPAEKVAHNVNPKLKALRTEINHDIVAIAKSNAMKKFPTVFVTEEAVIAQKENGSETRFTDSTHATVKPAAEPEVDDFDFLVQRAKVRKQKITLGEKMTDEFRNALIEACAKADVQITNMTPEQMMLYIKSRPEPQTSLNSVERPVVAPVVAPVTERNEAEEVRDVNNTDEQLSAVVAPVADVAEPHLAEESNAPVEEVVEAPVTENDTKTLGVSDSLAKKRLEVLNRHKEQYRQNIISASKEQDVADATYVEPAPVGEAAETPVAENDKFDDKTSPYWLDIDLDAPNAEPLSQSEHGDLDDGEPPALHDAEYSDSDEPVDNETKQPSKAKRIWDKSKKWVVGAAMVVGMGVLVRACGGGEKKEKDNDRAEFKTEHTAKSSFGADDTIPVVNIEESTPENIVFDGNDGGDGGEQSYDVPLEWNDGLTVTKSRFNRMFSYFPPHDDNNHTNWKNACINSMTHAHNFKLKNGDPMPWDEFFSKTLYLVAHTSKLNGLKCDEHGSMLAHHRDTRMGRAIAGAWRIITCGDTTDVNFEDTQDVLDAVDKKGNIHLTEGLKRLSPQIDVYNHFDPETGILMGDPNNHNIMVEVLRDCDPQVGFKGTGAAKKVKEEIKAPAPREERPIMAPLPPLEQAPDEAPEPTNIPEQTLNIPRATQAWHLIPKAMPGSEGLGNLLEEAVDSAAKQAKKNLDQPDNPENDSLDKLDSSKVTKPTQKAAQRMQKELKERGY